MKKMNILRCIFLKWAIILFLTTKKQFAPLLKKYAESPMGSSLSQAALETLSIIAYKQPISDGSRRDPRQSSGSVQKLVAKRLIEEKGRVDGPGRAILYGTTEYFMDYFGLKSLAELPDIQSMEDELEEDAPFDLFTTATNKQKQKENEDGTFLKVIAHAGITSRRKAEG